SIFPSKGPINHPGDPHDFLFLAALEKSTGNTAWVRTATGSSNHATAGLDVEVGPGGSVYLCGTYMGQHSWDDGTSSAGNHGKEMFVARFTSYGEREWMLPISGPNDDVLQTIAAGKQGALFIGGYRGTVDLHLARLSDTTAAVWPADPTRALLPASRCQSEGMLDLQALMVPLHAGNAVAVAGSAGLSGADAALGAPDGIGVSFNA